jgi:hypothetical protein
MASYMMPESRFDNLFLLTNTPLGREKTPGSRQIAVFNAPGSARLLSA